MWIFTSKAFASLVQHRTRPDRLVARARFKGHLEILFPGIAVKETPRADYLFRCIVTKKRAAQAYADSIMAIDYPNFKDSVKDHALHTAASQVWSVMFRAQDKAANPPAPRYTYAFDFSDEKNVGVIMDDDGTVFDAADYWDALEDALATS